MALTIANGGTISNVLTHGGGYLAITAPAALTGTVKVEVSGDSGVTWGNLQSGGSDLSIAATKAVTIPDFAGQLRLKSSGAEGAERVFGVATGRR